jgi:hypothetical protein
LQSLPPEGIQELRLRTSFYNAADPGHAVRRDEHLGQTAGIAAEPGTLRPVADRKRG